MIPEDMINIISLTAALIAIAGGVFSMIDLAQLKVKYYRAYKESLNSSYVPMSSLYSLNPKFKKY